MSEGFSFTRLRDSLGPDPTRWNPTGEVRDAGPLDSELSSVAHCGCGERIRYEYIVVNEDDGREQAIGSSCILNTAARLMSPEAHARLEAAVKSQPERVREAQAERDLPELLRDFTELRRRVFGLRDHIKNDPDLRQRVKELPTVEWPLNEPKETWAKTAAEIRRRYVKTWRSAAHAAEQIFETPTQVHPRNARLARQLARYVSEHEAAFRS